MLEQAKIDIITTKLGLLNINQPQEVISAFTLVIMIDRDNALWMYTKSDGKIESNVVATLNFQDQSNMKFTSLSGQLEVMSNELKKSNWNEEVGNWFWKGLDNEQVQLIKMTDCKGVTWQMQEGGIQFHDLLSK